MGKKSTSPFGNKKLEAVFPLLVAQMMTKYSVMIRQLSSGRSEQVRFNRFVNNKKVLPSSLVNFHWQEVSCKYDNKHLLIIGDTTTVSFTPNAEREYLGYIGENTNKEGFDIHSALVMDAEDGGGYGLGGVRMIRNLSPKGKPKVRTNAYASCNFEENELYKWFKVSSDAIANCSGARTYTLVGDREADVYDLIARTIQSNWQFLYRCMYNRKLGGESTAKLYDTIDSWPVKYEYEIDLQATKKRSKHKAKVDVKFGSLKILRPTNHPDKTLAPTIDLNVIEIKEQASTVIDDEKAIHWRLLTSHEVDNIEQVMKIIEWYRWRWNIEQAFRTLKSKGLDIEQTELKSYHGIANLATLSLIAAVQVMQLVQARDGDTNQKLENVFSPTEQKCLKLLKPKLEGKTIKQQNPHPAGSLAFGSWIIARLGGWKGYASERPPGPITMIRGLIRFYAMVEGFLLIQ